jgi:L-lactate dehydrogenase complex protein LldF
VCPVKVPLHHQLLAWRAVLAESGKHPRRRRLALAFAAALLMRPGRLRLADRVGRGLSRALPAAWLDALASPWTRRRALPEVPAESFRTWWRRAGRS